MKKLKKKDVINYLISGVAVLAIAASFVFGLLMLGVIKGRMSESATSNLLNTTRVIRDSMESYIDGDLESLSIVSNMRAKGDEMRVDRINNLAEATGFDWIVVVDENGEGVDEFEGKLTIADIPLSSEWVAESSGYSNLYIGQSGRPQIVLWVPVYRNSEFIGTVFGSVIINKYYTANAFTFYDGEGRTYLFNGDDGTWVLKSFGTDGTATRHDDIYSLLAASENKEEDINEFRAAIAEGKAGTAEFRFNSEDSYLCFLPMRSSPNWYITTVISRTDLLRESSEVQNLVNLAMGISCVTLAIATIGFTVWFVRKTRADAVSYRDKMFANVSANIDSMFLIYEASGKKAVFVSNNIKRLFGIDGSRFAEDAARLFDWCGIDETDPLREEFLSGNLKAAAVREVNVASESGAETRVVRLELIPADLGQEIAVLTDITKDTEIQRSLVDAMNRAEDASSAKNEFLSAMSHDLRTPLNGLSGMTAIAAANIDDKNRVSDCLTKISESTTALLALINEVLDMSQIESGKMELAECPFNIAQPLQEVVSINYPIISKKGHRVFVRIGKIEHEEVIGDASRLTRVASNLISNAIKYTPEGGQIDVSLTEKPCVIEGYGCYELTVSDNGIGMSEEFQKKLFVPFEREDDVRLSRIQGTGLGMSIVKNIVELMTGSIEVESEKGKGSTFRVTVSLKLNANEPEVDERLNGLSVLVVDDDTVVAKAVADILGGLGLSAEWSDNGADAVKKAKARAADGGYFAVIVDKNMPNMDGVETAKRIRKAVGNDVIIILSAFNWIECEKEARKAGVNEFLSKPLYKAKLQNKFTELVAGRIEVGAQAAVIASGKRVLLAEDNDLNCEIAVELLKMLGVETDHAADGESVVEKFAASAPKTYDAILMDIQMPKMNGYEATRAIRALPHKDAKTVPIIAMTADAFKKDIQAAHDAGMDDHMTKPISIELLAEKLGKYLSSDNMEGENEV